MKKITGICPAFYSAYDKNGNISYDGYQKHLRYLMDKGVKSIYACGSSGDAFYQTTEERKSSLEAIMEAAEGKVDVIAHIAAPNTRDSIELAQHAEKLGVHSIAAVPGVYYGLSDKTVYGYWKDIIDATDKVGFFIYNIPQTTRYRLSDGVLSELYKTGRIEGVKSSSDEILDIIRFRNDIGKNLTIFCGSDEQYLGGRAVGADGGIGGTYEAFLELFFAIDKAFLAGDNARAAELQSVATSFIFRLVSNGTYNAKAKYIMKLRGVDLGEARKPFCPLKEEDRICAENIFGDYLAALKKYGIEY